MIVPQSCVNALSILDELGVKLLGKNIICNTVKINGIQSRMSLKIRIKIVEFFLGHPVYSLAKVLLIGYMNINFYEHRSFTCVKNEWKGVISQT